MLPTVRIRLVLLLVALGLLAAAPAAHAGYRVGLGEQQARVFDDPLWQGLALKRVRYIVPWEWYRHDWQRAEVDDFMRRAALARQEVFVTFTAPRGCYDARRYSRARRCQAPAARAYRSAVRRFMLTYPSVRVFAPWNEINHHSQPLAHRPQLAAVYYEIVRDACPRCTVLAADVLDQPDVVPYLKAFLRASHGQGRLWGLHDYNDVNYGRSARLESVLRTVPGEVWFTETGGVVTFKPRFATSAQRAARAVKFMFQLADRFSRRRAGMRSKVGRVYVYNWYGERRRGAWDSGLVGPSGKPRPALAPMRWYARHRAR
jgi:hypothetical protein